MEEVSLEDQIECVERELGFRRRTYPRHVKLGKLTESLAARELARMEAVKRTLVMVRDASPRQVVVGAGR